MDVDASCQDNNNKKEKHTRGTFIKWMQGKCYGCGSKEHAKKDRNHECNICNHCGKTGHMTPVCFNKYISKASKLAGAAATANDSSAPSSSSSKPSISASATNSSPAKDNKNADLLAQLMVTVKKQEAELTALKASF
jgi:hypothetical protein